MRLRTTAALVATAVMASAAALSLAGPVAATTAPADQWLSDSGTAGNAGYNAGEHVITSANAGKLTTAWRTVATGGSGTFVAPAISAGVAYHAVNAANENSPSSLVATAVTTGKTLWTTTLPVGEIVFRGQSVSGNLVLLPFEGHNRAAGVVAVNLTTHKVAWSSAQTSPGLTAADLETGGLLVVDSGRAYLLTGSSVITAFRVSDGKTLWHTAPTTPQKAPSGIAAGGGAVFTVGNSGLTAFNGASGARAWTAPYGAQTLVVSGNRVFLAGMSTVWAFSSTGCGAATCKPVWTRAFPDVDGSFYYMYIGAVSSSSLFVSQRLSTTAGRVVRLAVSNGAQQWSAPVDTGPGAPVRAGSMVWVITAGRSLEGFSATATSSKPVRLIAEAADAQGAVQGIAAADGAVLVEAWPGYLTGYRLPA